MSLFRQIALDVSNKLISNNKETSDIEKKPVKSKLAKVASRTFFALAGAAPPDERDPEWQRVNSSIADVLKDTGVLFSKLARLQGDFAGVERSKLEEIGNKVRDLTDELSKFSSDFYNGDLNMKVSQTPFNYGGPAQSPGGGAPPPAPQAPQAGGVPPAPPTHDEEDFDVEAEITDEDKELDSEFEGSDEEDKKED